MDLRYMNLGDMQQTENTYFVAYSLSAWADISTPVLAAGRMNFPWILVGRYGDSALDSIIDTSKIGDHQLWEVMVSSIARELVFVGKDTLNLAFAFKKFSFALSLGEPEVVMAAMVSALADLIPLETANVNNDTLVMHDGKWKKLAGLAVRPQGYSMPVNISLDYDAINSIIRRDWLLTTRDKEIADFRDAAISLEEIIPDLDIWKFASDYAARLASNLGCDLKTEGASDAELYRLCDFMGSNVLPTPTLDSNLTTYTGTEIENVLRNG